MLEKKSKKGIVELKTLLNVRKTALNYSTVVGKLKNSEKVNIIIEESDWYQIKPSKYSGWVSAKYVKINKKK